jgi:flagellar assembly protein FliH
MSGSGRVIKADQISPVSFSSFRPDDALAKIQDEVVSAQRQLDEQRTSATSEVQSLYDKATQEGYRAGYDKGLRQGLLEQEAAYKARLAEEVNQRVDSAARLLAAVAEQLSAQPVEWVKQWENRALDMVTAVAERVARKAVAADPESILRTLREVLLMLARAPKITVTVHPTDRETLELNEPFWKEVLSKSAQVEFAVDPGLTRGGCRVATEHCAVDATIETQIGKLLREIAGTTPTVGLEPPPTDASP